MTPSTPGSMTGDIDMAEENSIVSVKERALKLNKIQSESELHKQVSPPRKKTVVINKVAKRHYLVSGSLFLYF